MNGTHTYIMRSGGMIDFFKHHLVRKALFQIWQKYRMGYREKRPLWIIQLEVIKQKTYYGDQLEMKYSDVTYQRENEIKLKDQKDLENSIGWWYLQINDLFNMNRKIWLYETIY